MTDPIWLGIDLGTQSVRAAAVDSTGNVLASASEKLTSTRDGARHEQDPRQWWSATVACCRAVTSQLAGRNVTALAIDATSGTILLIDEALQPLTNGLMYDDGRAELESKHINEAGAAFWREMGYSTQRSWALPKLLWLQRNEPTLFARGTLAHQNDFIHAKLAGKVLATDASHSLKTGYDTAREAWPSALFETLGLPARVFPEVVRPGAVIGTVSREAAAETGITAGCLIVAGMTDGCASQIAAGSMAPGEWNSVLGTTLVLKGVSEERLHDPLGVVYSHRSPSGKWLPGGASSTGAGMVTKMFPAADLTALNDAAAQRVSRLGAPRAILYPLAGQGERFPFSVPAAESFLLGTPQDEVEQYAALLAGVASIERLCFDYLALLGAPIDGRISITGGAVQSRTWNQFRADTLGAPLATPAVTEAVFGAAILAASHASSIEACTQTMVSTRETVTPSAASPQFIELHTRLVRELAARGWLPQHVADFSLARANA